MVMMNMAKQDILSVLCSRSNEGLCQEKWMAELTCPTVARILSTLLDCDLLERNKHPFACLLLLCGMPVFLTFTNTLVKHAGF